LDASDEALNARLRLRGDTDLSAAVAQQRVEDRRYRDSCNRVLMNDDLEASLTRLILWWREREVTA